MVCCGFGGDGVAEVGEAYAYEAVALVRVGVDAVAELEGYLDELLL